MNFDDIAIFDNFHQDLAAYASIAFCPPPPWMLANQFLKDSINGHIDKYRSPNFVLPLMKSDDFQIVVMR